MKPFVLDKISSWKIFVLFAYQMVDILFRPEKNLLTVKAISFGDSLKFYEISLS